MFTRHRAAALVALASSAFLVLQAHAQAQPAQSRGNQGMGHHRDSTSSLRADMRKLWEDHITYTRNFIISAAAGSPDQQAVTERLLRNQTDIGNAIKPFYGDAAGTQLTALLRNHITGAAALVTAAKANDQARVTQANNAWKANADSIAHFLSAANPRNWPEATLKSEMARHLELTLNEATAQLHGDWAGSIRAYDQVHDQILRMADMLTDGIAAQHPDRVASR
jgi:hypothetical protein